MKSLPKLTHAYHYTFGYRGINGEIVRRASIIPEFQKDSWCSYLYLHLENFSNQELANSLWLEDIIDDKNGRVSHDYYKNEFIAGLNFHGGVTFYDKYCSKPRIIKVGCDYQHYWDEGQEYNEIYVQSELMNVIDSIHDSVEYKIWCSYFGNKYLESEGTYTDESKSSFHSFEGVKEWEEKMKTINKQE